MSLAGRIVRTAGAWLPRQLLRQLEGPAALFFHGVELSISDPELQSNHHRIEEFYDIALTLKSEFDVAPLNALADVLARPRHHRRTVFLMSDDGYANTLGVAAQVLHSLTLPWALFVSSQHIDSGSRNPMFLAKLFFRFAPHGSYVLPGLRDPLVLGDDRKRAAELGLRELRRLPVRDANLAVGHMVELMERHGLADLLSRYGSDTFLDWNGVRALAQRGVIIGAHAHWHWPMHNGESPEVLTMQAELPRRRVEAEVGPCQYFAYPFGNVGDVSAQAWRAVRDAGYSHAFTTLSGTLDASRNDWLLPRYGLRSSEPNLANKLRLLRLGNGRLGRWQQKLN